MYSRARQLLQKSKDQKKRERQEIENNTVAVVQEQYRSLGPELPDMGPPPASPAVSDHPSYNIKISDTDQSEEDDQSYISSFKITDTDQSEADDHIKGKGPQPAGDDMSGVKTPETPIKARPTQAGDQILRRYGSENQNRTGATPKLKRYSSARANQDEHKKDQVDRFILNMKPGNFQHLPRYKSNCWINSAIYGFFNLPEVREFIVRILKELGEEKEPFLQLLYNILSDPKVHDIIRLQEEFYPPEMWKPLQLDSGELIMFIMRRLEKVAKKDFEKTFGYKRKTQHTCQECGNEEKPHTSVGEVITIPMNPDGFGRNGDNCRSNIDLNEGVELVDGECNSPQCGKVGPKKFMGKVLSVQHAKYVVCNLTRNHIETGDHHKKNNSKANVEHQIVWEGANYKLRSVISHEGKVASGGHFTSLYIDDNNDMYHFDDQENNKVVLKDQRELKKFFEDASTLIYKKVENMPKPRRKPSREVWVTNNGPSINDLYLNSKKSTTNHQPTGVISATKVGNKPKLSLVNELAELSVGETVQPPKVITSTKLSDQQNKNQLLAEVELEETRHNELREKTHFLYENQGNTCFAGAGLNCLMNADGIRNQIIDNRNTSDTCRNICNLSLSPRCEGELRRLLSEVKNEFADGRMHDSCEFMNDLLVKLNVSTLK